MLVSISGPSSSGKGTLLYDLKTFGFQVIHEQYARNLLNRYNLSVTQLYKLPFSDIKQFHKDLVDYKDNVEREFIHSNDLVLVERSFIDFYVYQTTQTGIEDKELYDLCEQKTQEFYSNIIYLLECPNIEDDGIRVVHEDKINSQKTLFKSIWSNSIISSKVIQLDTLSRSDRLSKITSLLKGS